MLIGIEFGEIEDFLIGQADSLWKIVNFHLRDCGVLVTRFNF